MDYEAEFWYSQEWLSEHGGEEGELGYPRAQEKEKGISKLVCIKGIPKVRQTKPGSTLEKEEQIENTGRFRFDV